MRAVTTMVIGLLAAGCGQAELLPLVDEDGAMAGTFDPASGEIRVDAEASAVENAEGAQVEMVDGLAPVEWTLAPGDAVLLLDGSDEVLETLFVEHADLVDGMSDEEAESRHPGCYPQIK